MGMQGEQFGSDMAKVISNQSARAINRSIADLNLRPVEITPATPFFQNKSFYHLVNNENSRHLNGGLKFTATRSG
jgi:hypothetical protein